MTAPHRQRAGTAWTAEDDATLLKWFKAGADVELLADTLQRSKAAVVTRLTQRGLLVKTPDAYWRATYFCNFKDLKEPAP